MKCTIASAIRPAPIMDRYPLKIDRKLFVLEISVLLKLKFEYMLFSKVLDVSLAVY
jgi:hypothetical protein